MPFFVFRGKYEKSKNNIRLYYEPKEMEENENWEGELTSENK